MSPPGGVRFVRFVWAASALTCVLGMVLTFTAAERPGEALTAIGLAGVLATALWTATHRT